MNFLGSCDLKAGKNYDAGLGKYLPYSLGFGNTTVIG